MGEIADDITEGLVCEICGQFFASDDGDIHKHGYPVECWDCWRDLQKKERKQYHRAEVKTL